MNNMCYVKVHHKIVYVYVHPFQLSHITIVLSLPKFRLNHNNASTGDRNYRLELIFNILRIECGCLLTAAIHTGTGVDILPIKTEQWFTVTYGNKASSTLCPVSRGWLADSFSETGLTCLTGHTYQMCTLNYKFVQDMDDRYTNTNTHKAKQKTPVSV